MKIKKDFVKIYYNGKLVHKKKVNVVSMGWIGDPKEFDFEKTSERLSKLYTPKTNFPFDVISDKYCIKESLKI